MEKSEAQRRNEEEVKRIMRERGFQTADDCGARKKSRPRVRESIVGRSARLVVRVFLIGVPVIVLGFVIYNGVLWMGINGKSESVSGNNSQSSEETTVSEKTTPSNSAKDSAADLSVCLNSSPHVSGVGNDNYYSDLIKYYDYQINCYAIHGITNNEHLAMLKRNREDVISGKASHEEYERSLKELEQRSNESYAGFSTVEDNYESQRAEQEAAEAQARLEAIEKEKQEKAAQCAALKTQYGNKTVEQLAEQDAVGLKSVWQSAQTKANNQRRSCTSGSNVVLNESAREACYAKADSYDASANSAYQAYVSKLSSQKTYYRNLFKVCD
ncbi:MAG: hypothetical protein Q4B65_01195 [Candidatus Saccharibacteria bacterium]|nr:hypothetical protein [Candidatus Saccharibacteria bacterium]